MRFLYGQNGLVGFISDGITYTYRKNLFGDIIGIFSGNTEKATYVYDAWGNCTVTKDIDGLGTINPFRYRGYYWDSNLGFYYLISRYYDPQTGRFINSDTLDYLDPETLGGLNLYAYCGNNPVMGVDPSGHSFLLALAVLLFTPVGGFLAQTIASTLGYLVNVGWALGDLAFNNGEGAWSDMNSINWNLFNSDETATLNSSMISFYKGVPVYRTNGERPGSFGFIFLNSDSDSDALRHERGHNSQLMMMGLGTYGFTVAIPSPLKLGPWAKNYRYHYAPWETMADILGGVNQLYGMPIPQQQIKNAWVYYAISTICFPLATLYWWS